MADRHQAFLFVMSHEDPKLTGVVVTDDDGGKTRFGVDSKSNPQALSDGFYTLPTDQALLYAENVFIARYWNPVAGDQISNQRVANQFVDLCFNSGDTEAIKLLQRSANRHLSTPISVDGKFGPHTLGAVNDCCVTDAAILLDTIKAQAVVFYQLLVQENPQEYTPAIYKSWVARLNA